MLHSPASLKCNRIRQQMPKVTVQYTRSLVVPSAANITGQILKLGNWGKKVNEYLKVIKDKAVDVKGAKNSLRLLS